MTAVQGQLHLSMSINLALTSVPCFSHYNDFRHQSDLEERDKHLNKLLKLKPLCKNSTIYHVIFQFFFFNKSAKMSTILCFSVNMGCCVYINEKKKELK